MKVQGITPEARSVSLWERGFMLSSLRSHATYANVVSTICLFAVLGGGTAYAAVTITGKNVKNGSLTGADVKNNSLTGSDVKSLTAGDFKGGQLPRGATGATGPQGPQGIQGVPGTTGAAKTTVRTEVAGVPNGTSSATSHNVRCNTGERAVSGGASFRNSAGDDESGGANTRYIAYSRPTTRVVPNDPPTPNGGTATGWETGVYLTSSPNNITAVYYAVCVSP